MKILFIGFDLFGKLAAHKLRVLISSLAVCKTLKDRGKSLPCLLLSLNSFFEKQKNTSHAAFFKTNIKRYQTFLFPLLHPITLPVNLCLFTLCILRIFAKERDLIYIHAHTNYAAFLAILVGKKIFKRKVWFDMHGVWADELVYSRIIKKGGLRWQYVCWMERFCIEHCDGLIVVSQSMKHYADKVCRRRRKNILGIPCCVDPNNFKHNLKIRKQMRLKHRLSEKLVVLYQGSLGAWHTGVEMVETFLKIKAKRTDAHFLVMTPSQEEMKTILRRYNISPQDYTLLFLLPEEVSKYTMMADMGLLLRRESKVNAVAFPTKFAEYLACGVPVLCTDAIRDIRHLVIKNRLGASIENLGSKEAIEEGVKKILSLLENESREAIAIRCSNFAMEYLNWEKAACKIIEAYENFLLH